MQVSIMMTVEIDPRAWGLEYGIPIPTDALNRGDAEAALIAIRNDVREYVNNMVQDKLSELGMLKGE